jgi:hypothetical protein
MGGHVCVPGLRTSGQGRERVRPSSVGTVMQQSVSESTKGTCNQKNITKKKGHTVSEGGGARPGMVC